MMDLRAFRYRLPMRPIRLAGVLHTVREGLVLCDAETGRHWGEAAPLVGLSRESLDDVVSQWRNGPPYALPSLRFAVGAIEASAAIAESSRGKPGGSIYINGLLSGSAVAVLHAAREFSRRGHRCVKLKIGPHLGDVPRCAEVVRRVRECLRADQQLRLDANRAWTVADAIQFGTLVDSATIEYCEEPTRSPLDLEPFFAETGVRYALDETLRERTDLGPFPHAAALVVKPMLHGNRADIASLRRYGIPLVFSGAFETGIGTRHIAQLADEFSPHLPAGLDSYSWLQEDIVTPRLVVDEGRLSLGQRGSIELRQLQELSR